MTRGLGIRNMVEYPKLQNGSCKPYSEQKLVEIGLFQQ